MRQRHLRETHAAKERLQDVQPDDDEQASDESDIDSDDQSMRSAFDEDTDTEITELYH